MLGRIVGVKKVAVNRKGCLSNKIDVVKKH